MFALALGFVLAVVLFVGLVAMVLVGVSQLLVILVGAVGSEQRKGIKGNE